MYRYPNSNKVYRLVSVTGFIYRFACGHWCTDNVFADLINVKTGIANYKQTTLFINLST